MQEFLAARKPGYGTFLMTDETLLNTALHGGEAEWARLHELCQDRAKADSLARMLERHASAEDDTAAAWASVLADIHPGLKVVLPLKGAHASRADGGARPN